MKVFFTLLLLSGGLSLAQTNRIPVSEKLVGLSTLWQEANYNFAYFDQVEHLDWDQEYTNTINAVLQTTTDVEYYELLQKFLVTLSDGHTQVYMPDDLEQLFIKPNIEVAKFGDQYYITNVTKSLKKTLPIGSQVMTVNGLPISIYLEQNVYPYIAASTPEAKRFFGLKNLFKGLEHTEFEVTLQSEEKGAKVVNFRLEPKMSSNWVHSGYLTEAFSHEIIDNISYVNIPSFENDDVITKFQEIIPEIETSKALILDLRKNIGGKSSLGLQLATYLTPKSELITMPWKSRQHVASLKAWGNSGLQLMGYEHVKEYEDYGELNAWIEIPADTMELNIDRPKLDMPIVILTSIETASAAENFLVYARQNPHVVTIGSTTFGSTGQPIYFSLPGGGFARICAKRNYDIDGTEFVGKGIQPDILVPLTLKNELQDIDGQLQYALEYLNKAQE